jgi:hypothetical protein
VNSLLIIVGTIMFLHLITRAIASKGSIVKKPCVLHKWEYIESGMKCSVCGGKPGDRQR